MGSAQPRATGGGGGFGALLDVSGLAQQARPSGTVSVAAQADDTGASAVVVASAAAGGALALLGSAAAAFFFKRRARNKQNHHRRNAGASGEGVDRRRVGPPGPRGKRRDERTPEAWGSEEAPGRRASSRLQPLPRDAGSSLDDERFDFDAAEVKRDAVATAAALATASAAAAKEGPMQPRRHLPRKLGAGSDEGTSGPTLAHIRLVPDVLGSSSYAFLNSGGSGSGNPLVTPLSGPRFRLQRPEADDAGSTGGSYDGALEGSAVGSSVYARGAGTAAGARAAAAVVGPSARQARIQAAGNPLAAATAGGEGRSGATAQLQKGTAAQLHKMPATAESLLQLAEDDAAVVRLARPRSGRLARPRGPGGEGGGAGLDAALDDEGRGSRFHQQQHHVRRQQALPDSRRRAAARNKREFTPTVARKGVDYSAGSGGLGAWGDEDGSVSYVSPMSRAAIKGSGGGGGGSKGRAGARGNDSLA